MNNPPKSRWYWRLLRRGLIGLAVLVTLAAILITEENWRGKHQWEAYKRTAEARGERFDMDSVVLPSVPDDQNFFYAPIVANTFQTRGGTNMENRVSTNSSVLTMSFQIWHGHMGERINQGGNWQKGILTDLKQWQDGLRLLSTTPEGKTNGFPVPLRPQTSAADVLFALSMYDPELEELRQASQRPYMRIPLNYENDFDSARPLIPWLAAMKNTVQFLQLRVIAEEQNHQSQEALDDLKLMIRVNDCIREQPFLISHLVRMAIQAVLVQPIYEGLAQHCWSDQQLSELEQTLAKQDFLADYRFAINGEKVFAIDTFEKQRVTHELKSVTGENGDQMVTISLSLMPSAYFYQNELAIAKMYGLSLLPLADPTNHTVDLAKYRAAQNEFQRLTNHYSLYSIHARMMFPAVSRAVLRFANTQVYVDLARVACALERYHLAHGGYPEKLDELEPQFIEHMPPDAMNGQPLHYRLTADGRFVLYSVGLNERDDGGTVVFSKDGAVDRNQGDCVWQYPAK